MIVYKQMLVYNWVDCMGKIIAYERKQEAISFRPDMREEMLRFQIILLHAFEEKLFRVIVQHFSPPPPSLSCSMARSSFLRRVDNETTEIRKA